MFYMNNKMILDKQGDADSLKVEAVHKQIELWKTTIFQA